MAFKLEEIIPLDKSWLIRLGVLDLLNDYTDIDDFLENQKTLSDDLVALQNATKQWRLGMDIDVGESGTLYRYLQFAAWNLGQNRKFIKHGTLKAREITNDSSIVNLSITDLLKLDNYTSQWASAAVLCGSTEAPPKIIPYKLGLTYEAIQHWNKARSNDRIWIARKDATIVKQANAYLTWNKTGSMKFKPKQAEDYCFARAFDLITPEEGEARWPSLRQHESDRIATMEIALTQNVVDSADHRVVQAIAMRKGKNVSFAHPEAVNKSWPEFWQLVQ